jgi:hypothetical protein
MEKPSSFHQQKGALLIFWSGERMSKEVTKLSVSHFQDSCSVPEILSPSQSKCTKRTSTDKWQTKNEKSLEVKEPACTQGECQYGASYDTPVDHQQSFSFLYICSQAVTNHQSFVRDHMQRMQNEMFKETMHNVMLKEQ